MSQANRPQRSHKSLLRSNGSPRMLIDKYLERSPLEHCQVFVATVGTAVAVNIEDVKSTLTIHSSKTDQEGKGESLYIGDPTRKVIKQYCAAAEIKTGVLFRRIRRGEHTTAERISVVSARRIIEKRAKDAGIEGFISGHSLRVGTAVSLAQAGATLVDMQTAGQGQVHRCRLIMQRLNWRNAGRWLGSFMGSNNSMLYYYR